MTEFEEISEMLRKGVRQLIFQRAQIDEEIVRGLLCRWVSGLDPAIAKDEWGNIIGLCDADAPLGSEPFILRRAG